MAVYVFCCNAQSKSHSDLLDISRYLYSINCPTGERMHEMQTKTKTTGERMHEMKTKPNNISSGCGREKKQK
jgi:hypothetical protein